MKRAIAPLCTVIVALASGGCVSHTTSETEVGVLVCKIVGEKPPVEPKLMDGRENKYRFVRYIEETEGTTILKPSVVGRKDG